MRPRRFWAQNATRCLYHEGARTRDDVRGATWSHQLSPIWRVTKDPDQPIVKVRRASAAIRAAFLAVRPGDLRRTLAASAAASSATRAGETGSSACTVPAPSTHFPSTFLSRPTPVPPPFPRPSWRGALMASCSAPLVTMGHTSGLMASSLTMDPQRSPQRTRRRSEQGRARLQ